MSKVYQVSPSLTRQGTTKPYSSISTVTKSTLPKTPSNSNIKGATVSGYAQFVHEGGYAITKGQRRAKIKTVDGARKSVKVGRKKASARDVIGEAIREAPKYFQHIEAPQPAIHLWGKRLDELVDWYEDLQRKAAMQTETMLLKRTGKLVMRKQRSSTVVMIASVFSYPERHDLNNPGYAKWLRMVTAWCKRHYGRNLVSVICHQDENFGHVHCIAQNAGNPGASVRHLMAGFSEVQKAKAEGTKGRKLVGIYNDGYVQMQDHFHARVGAKCGLERKSEFPKPRLDYRSAKELNRQRAELEHDAQELMEQKARVREIIAIANAENQALNFRLQEQLGRADVMALSAANDAMLKEGLAAAKDRDLEFAEALQVQVQLGEISQSAAKDVLKSVGINSYFINKIK
jgi:hypothetical protein